MSIKMVMGQLFLHMHLTCHGKKLVDVTFMSIFGEYFLHCVLTRNGTTKVHPFFAYFRNVYKVQCFKSTVHPGGILGISIDGDDGIEPKLKTQKNPKGSQQNPKRSLTFQR